MLRSATRLLPTRLSSVLVQSASLESLEAVNDALNLQLVQESGEQSSLLVPLVWLRDHCREPSSYNHATNQRTSNMVNLFEEAVIKRKEDVEVHEQRTIHINWQNGLKSKYEIDELLKSCLNRNLPSTSEDIMAWDASWDAGIPRLNVSDYSFAEFCQLFVRYGVVIIDGVEANAEATEKLCREIAPIHDTYYGSFWVFSNETKDEDYHEDTAYGQQAIGPHTDGTYFEQTPGIQVFHCLTPAHEGGDTILVDGKRCVDILRVENPAAYQLLTTKRVDHHYLEGGDEGNVLNCVGRHRPVIEVDGQGNLVQLRFNPYDRAPLKSLRYDDPASAKETLQFYKAYSRFSQICHDPVNSIRTSLQPGSVIFIDNFRVLHSRTAFKGFREMSGCYLSRDNLLAKARPHLNKDIRYAI